MRFQSTQPKRAATNSAFAREEQDKFQSTQPKRAATVGDADLGIEATISIHAAQEGCDVKAFRNIILCSDFNPRSPRGLRPETERRKRNRIPDFNPRSPRGLRRNGRCKRNLPCSYFNPRSPRGLRHCLPPLVYFFKVISIHAAQEGCDANPAVYIHIRFDFNPRSPRGLRHKLKRSIKRYRNFNPRSPRGLRQHKNKL